VLGHLVPRDARVIAAGHSRGGFLSLMLAGHRPEQVAAVVNFSGGWHGITARLGETENSRRMVDHAARLARAAERSKSPSFWVYASRDPLYQDSVPAALVNAWRNAGGRAEFVYVTEHTLPNPHLTPQAPALWAKALDAFLKGVPMTGTAN
jgi:pimeloyl-ACP methyl ester carboxylesterase